MWSEDAVLHTQQPTILVFTCLKWLFAFKKFHLYNIGIVASFCVVIKVKNYRKRVRFGRGGLKNCFITQNFRQYFFSAQHASAAPFCPVYYSVKLVSRLF